MGMLSFLKTAGEKLFGVNAAQAAETANNNLEAANQAAADAIVDYINKQNLNIEALAVNVDAANGSVMVAGITPDQATKEKIILCCGNVHGIDKVEDNISVTEPSDESQYHMVERGDTLSAIAKKYYGNANKYQQIFEANKPMLSHPDKIYPGQNLRIPPDA